MPRRRPSPDAEWGAWLAVSAAVFATLEGHALLRRVHERTLSATLRRWLGIRPSRWYRAAASAAFLGFLAWLALHIVVAVDRDEEVRDGTP
ncbi:hypothetical protein [Saccharothrix hoggarensis]|uniref:Uncharacterized protein n=1 Tax=Saccharothrix hoggarensis TaxID=913853 RepID=A0ABW3QNH3_9PSEU